MPEARVGFTGAPAGRRAGRWPAGPPAARRYRPAAGGPAGWQPALLRQVRIAVDLSQQAERRLVVLLALAGLRVEHFDGELHVAQAAVEEIDAFHERAGVAEAH